MTTFSRYNKVMIKKIEYSNYNRNCTYTVIAVETGS